MTFKIVVSDKLKLIFSKLRKKDKARFIAVKKKILQISGCDAVSIQHFKNLKGSMSQLKRVHIESFVLIFRVNDDNVIFEDLTHHDSTYKR